MAVSDDASWHLSVNAVSCWIRITRSMRYVVYTQVYQRKAQRWLSDFWLTTIDQLVKIAATQSIDNETNSHPALIKYVLVIEVLIKFLDSKLFFFYLRSIEPWHFRWSWVTFEGHFGDIHSCCYFVCAADARSVSRSAHTNVIKIAIPQNGGHFETQAAIGRRNTLH